MLEITLAARWPSTAKKWQPYMAAINKTDYSRYWNACLMSSNSGKGLLPQPLPGPWSFLSHLMGWLINFWYWNNWKFWRFSENAPDKHLSTFRHITNKEWVVFQPILSLFEPFRGELSRFLCQIGVPIVLSCFLILFLNASRCTFSKQYYLSTTTQFRAFFFVQGGSRPKRTIFRVFWVLGFYGVELIFLKNTTPNLAAIGRQWPRGHSVPMRVKIQAKIDPQRPPNFFLGTPNFKKLFFWKIHPGKI